MSQWSIDWSANSVMTGGGRDGLGGENNISGTVQEFSNSSVNTLELPQSCTEHWYKIDVDK